MRLEERLAKVVGAHRLAAILAFLSVLAGTFLITLQYRHDGQTYDEGAHLACGMEWLTRGTYTYETLHPPLGRAATAVLPALAGDRAQGSPTMLGEGRALLQFQGKYWRNLTLARLGVLPFFWLACFLVYSLAAEWLGAWAGAAATATFALCPPVLAHAGLATTDSPLVAMYIWSLIRFFRLVSVPTMRNALLAGLSLGLGLLTKFTELPFFGLAAAALLLLVSLRVRKLAVPVRLLVAGAVLVPLVIWAGYRFSVGPVFSKTSTTAQNEAKLEALSPGKRKLLTATPVPADEFFRGLVMAKGTGSQGRLSYLLGETYQGGRRSFFPVAVLVKTPIPTLLLMGAGLVWVFADPKLRGKPAVWLVLLGAASPMLVAMAGQINIGLRHALPSYPFFALLAGLGAAGLWGVHGARLLLPRRVAVVVLIAWVAVSAAEGAPDFLTYFNEFAATHRTHYLVNSDLDWGQGLPELAVKLKEVHAPAVAIAYAGDPDAADLSMLPHPQILQPGDRAHGWVAISESAYELFPAQMAWLAPYPYTEVEKTIRLYDLP